MNSKKYLHKQFTCKKDWRDLRSNDEGMHCHTCNLEVIDFTTMNEEQIIDYFKNRKTSKTCGRLNETQFDKVNAKLNQGKEYNKNKVLVPLTVASIFLTSSCNTTRNAYNGYDDCDNAKLEILNGDINESKSEFTLLRGTVVDEQGEAIMGASITINQGEEEIIADEYGKFEHKYTAVSRGKISIYSPNYYDCEFKISEIENKEVKITLPEIWIGEVVVVPSLKWRWENFKKRFKKQK